MSVLTCLLPGAALAGDLPLPADTGWFVRTRALIGLADSPGSFSTFPAGATGEHQTSYTPQEYFGVGAGVGYGFQAWGIPMRAVVDGSLNFRHDVDVDAKFPSGVATKYQGNIRTWDIRLSLLADVLRTGWGRFYVGGGLGASYVSTLSEIESIGQFEVNRQWKPVPSVEAGIVFDGFSRRVIPEVSYRFRYVGDLESGTFPGGEKLRYEHLQIHDFTFGFRVPLEPQPLSRTAVALYEPTPDALPSDGRHFNGFHVGVFGGGGFANEIKADGLTIPDGSATPYNPPQSTYGLSDTNFVAGGQLGVDWQWRWLVLGLQGEAGYLGFEDSSTDPSSPGGDTKTTIKTKWYGAVSARAGVAWDRLLLYGRVGVGFIDAEGKTVDTCSTGGCSATTVNAAEDRVLMSFTPGVGLEYAFNDHWSLGAEYRYIYVWDGVWPEGAASDGNYYRQEVQLNRIHTARAGINYRW